ncbi:hypothetical protein SK128_018907 [Halocaridina rubra]|uniref:Uncharacterized protein n=1 Tax=Halocaridina rubra TaxID=373956 RepID=A0AAN9A625_HALRR
MARKPRQLEPKNLLQASSAFTAVEVLIIALALVEYPAVGVTRNSKPSFRTSKDRTSDLIRCSILKSPHSIGKAQKNQEHVNYSLINRISHYNQFLLKPKYPLLRRKRREAVFETKLPPNFEYEVHDEERGTHFGHAESRDGHKVQGQYFVHLPDGRIQVVTYVADENGYFPIITYKGKDLPSYGTPGSHPSQVPAMDGPQAHGNLHSVDNPPLSVFHTLDHYPQISYPLQRSISFPSFSTISKLTNVPLPRIPSPQYLDNSVNSKYTIPKPIPLPVVPSPGYDSQVILENDPQSLYPVRTGAHARFPGVALIRQYPSTTFMSLKPYNIQEHTHPSHQNEYNIVKSLYGSPPELLPKSAPTNYLSLINKETYKALEHPYSILDPYANRLNTSPLNLGSIYESPSIDSFHSTNPARYVGETQLELSLYDNGLASGFDILRKPKIPKLSPGRETPSPNIDILNHNFNNKLNIGVKAAGSEDVDEDLVDYTGLLINFDVSKTLFRPSKNLVVREPPYLRSTNADEDIYALKSKLVQIPTDIVPG